MTILKFLSKEKLVEYLDEELRVFLNFEEIYEINQYGWLTDDRPDPEYIGFAMWQTDPPRCRDRIPNLPESPQFPAISQTDMARILRAGLEFEELMKSARHSIGLAYLYHKDDDGLSHCFNHHFFDTVMKLDMATDRLRDFFIAAVSALTAFALQEDTTFVAENPTLQHKMFCRPFRQTRDKLAENPRYYEELLDCIEELLPLVEETALYRITGGESQDSGLIGETVINHLSKCYKLLIETSNKIFLAEYLLRNFNNETPLARIVLSQ